MRTRRYPFFLLILVLLLAAALRFFHLDAQSFWSDEGNSAAMVGRAALDIVRRSGNDISPPLYYLLLAGWGRLVGTSEFALRALSVGWSLVTVALTAALGHRVGGRRVALFAALLAALSPFALHYAQEARMYAMVTTLAAASWYAWLGAIQSPMGTERQKAKGKRQKAKGEGEKAKAEGVLPRRSSVVSRRSSLWWAYVLLSVAILYTQYFAASVLIAQNVAWGCWWGGSGGAWGAWPTRARASCAGWRASLPSPRFFCPGSCTWWTIFSAGPLSRRR